MTEMKHTFMYYYVLIVFFVLFKCWQECRAAKNPLEDSWYLTEIWKWRYVQYDETNVHHLVIMFFPKE